VAIFKSPSIECFAEILEAGETYDLVRHIPQEEPLGADGMDFVIQVLARPIITKSWRQGSFLISEFKNKSTHLVLEQREAIELCLN